MAIRRPRPKWLRFTEETNALDYLERAGEFIRLTETDQRAWKWAILSLHGALYGFAIVACKGTSPDIVTRTTKRGRRYLLSLEEALRMCQDQTWMGTLEGGQALSLSPSQSDSVRKVKATLRNNFEHYTPGGWSIEIHGLPTIAMDILDVIRFLSVETFRYQNLKQRQRRKIRSIVFQSKRFLRRSALHKEALAMAEEASSTPRE